MASANLLRIHNLARTPCLHFLYPASTYRAFSARSSRFASVSPHISLSSNATPASVDVQKPPAQPTATPASTDPASLSSDAAAPQTAAAPPPAPKPARQRPTIRSTKTIVTIKPKAMERLRALLSAPTPQMIRIGVRNKGCAGLSYHLEYVEQPGKFDEIVEQDGVKVLVDSKAMFSIIGSEMDWTDDALSSKFTFRNPNIEDSCGCGESFKVGGN